MSAPTVGQLFARLRMADLFLEPIDRRLWDALQRRNAGENVDAEIAEITAERQRFFSTERVYPPAGV